jgi:hypothetical protein
MDLTVPQELFRALVESPSVPVAGLPEPPEGAAQGPTVPVAGMSYGGRGRMLAQRSAATSPRVPANVPPFVLHNNLLSLGLFETASLGLCET